ncbi:MAG: HDOD domain-containing protein [Phycisphaerae bacterium]
MSDERLKLLFVDDDEGILDGLRRVLRPYRAEWDATFALGGESALKLLGTQRFDVVVSDMRMPGISGGELLRLTRGRCPDTIRFTLTAHTELDQLLPHVGVIHQFLRKPCDPRELRAAISLASYFRGRLARDETRRVVSALERMPAPSDTVRELLARLENQSSSFASVAEVIERDGGLTAKLLHLANSAFFGSTKRVTRVVDAVGRLGLRTIKHLAVTSQLYDRLVTPAPAVQEYAGRLWSRSADLASRSRATATALEFPPSSLDAAYLAGLLCEIGRLVLTWHLGEDYLRLVRQSTETGVSLAELEQATLGSSQSAIGGYLLALWAFDREVVEAVTYVAHPRDSATTHADALAALHLTLCDDAAGAAANGVVRDAAFVERFAQPGGSPPGIATENPCGARA